MNKYLIRFNKSRGQEGRGTDEHVWRVFENGTEHLVKDIFLNVISWGEADGEDWNVACYGFMNIVPSSELAIINPEKLKLPADFNPYSK
jgi:hypothetical protein